MPSRRPGIVGAALALVAWPTAAWSERAAVFLPEARIPSPLSGGPGVPSRFGDGVAIAGDTMVVGAWAESAVDSNSGAAYVYVRSGTAWTLQQQLKPPNLGARNWFGSSVAISGDTVVVGAHASNSSANNEGRAYVFVRSGTAWPLQQTLQAPDGLVDDLFGNSVSIEGDMVVVGARSDDTAAGANAGSAHIFVRSGTSWSHRQRLEAPDAAAGDNFGSEVSVSGDTLAVAADSDDTTAGADAGAVYVFVRSEAGWTLQQKLTASDGAAGDSLGTVSLGGETLVAGADMDNTAAGANAGSAYVFSRVGDQWIETQKLTASDAGASDFFGFRVSLTDETIVIGAPNKRVRPETLGAAYVFSRSDAGWREEQKLMPQRTDSSNCFFGNGVSAWGDTLAVGSPQSATPGRAGGVVYTYRAQREADVAVGLTDAPDPVAGLQPFTYSIAVTNLGPERAYGLSVRGTLPAGAAFESVSGVGWVCATSGPAVTCTRAQLDAGLASALSIVMRAPADAATLTFVASVSHQGTDPAPANDAATESTTVTAAPAGDLSIAVSHGGVEARWGQPFTWTLTVGNAGPDTATLATVSDAFPTAVTQVAWTCSASPGSSCPAAGSGDISASVTLLPAGTAIFIATGIVSPGTASLTNTATITAPSGFHDPDTANNSASVTTVSRPIQYYTVTPCRILDTRLAPPPLAANGTRTFAVGGSCGIPADARAVMANLVAVNPGAAGNLRVYPSGQPVPTASALNFAAGRTRANNAIVPLGAAGQIDVRCDMAPGSNANTHFVLDAFGYFR